MLVLCARLLHNCRVKEQSGRMSQVSVAWCGQQLCNNGVITHVLQDFVGCVEHANSRL